MNGPNDPTINRKYNYFYETKNIVNNRCYYGVHRTDNLNDRYLGSGTILKRAIIKYGKENFTKIIILFFDTYQEALDKEAEIVTLDFIKNNNTYNICEGGFGGHKWTEEGKKIISEAAKKRWQNQEYKEYMNKTYFQNKKRNKHLSNMIKEWIKNNPEKHAEKMYKINTNKDKIQKTASKHRGMKRTNKTRQNISEAILLQNKLNPEISKKRCGEGMIHIYNPTTLQVKRHIPNTPLPENFIIGRPKRKIYG
jgi:hypothetical protein